MNLVNKIWLYHMNHQPNRKFIYLLPLYRYGVVCMSKQKTKSNNKQAGDSHKEYKNEYYDSRNGWVS